MGKILLVTILGAMAFGCGGESGSGAGGASGGGGAGGGSADPALLYQGTFDDYPVQMALLDDGVAIVTQSYTGMGAPKLEKVPFATGVAAELATLPADYPPTNAVVSDGTSVAVVDTALDPIDPTLGNRVSEIATNGGNKLVDLLTPSDKIRVISLVGMDHDEVYFLGAGLQAVSRNGAGKVRTLTSTFVNAGAIGDHYAFLATSEASPRIIAVPLAGGAEIEIAKESRFVYAFAAAGSSAFWVVAPSTDTATKTLMTGSVGGAGAKALASGKLYLVAADDSGVYALTLTGPDNTADLEKIDPKSGKATTLATTPVGGPVNLAVRSEVADVVMLGAALVEIAPMSYSNRNQIRRYPK